MDNKNFEQEKAQEQAPEVLEAPTELELEPGQKKAIDNSKNFEQEKAQEQAFEETPKRTASPQPAGSPTTATQPPPADDKRVPLEGLEKEQQLNLLVKTALAGQEEEAISQARRIFAGDNHYLDKFHDSLISKKINANKFAVFNNSPGYNFSRLFSCSLLCFSKVYSERSAGSGH